MWKRWSRITGLFFFLFVLFLFLSTFLNSWRLSYNLLWLYSLPSRSPLRSIPVSIHSYLNHVPSKTIIKRPHGIQFVLPKYSLAWGQPPEYDPSTRGTHPLRKPWLPSPRSHQITNRSSAREFRAYLCPPCWDFCLSWACYPNHSEFVRVTALLCLGKHSLFVSS